MSQALTAPLIVVGTEQKTSNKNPQAPKTFWITSGYVHLPGMLFPQAVELFVGDVTKVLTPGDYVVPLTFAVKDNRPSVELDLSAARPVKAAA